MLLQNPSTIASASIAVDAFFQFRKHLWAGGTSFLVIALWHTEQYLFRMPTNKICFVLYPIRVAYIVKF